MRVDDALLHSELLAQFRHNPALRANPRPEAATPDGALPSAEATIATAVAQLPTALEAGLQHDDPTAGAQQGDPASAGNTGRFPQLTRDDIVALQEEAHVSVHVEDLTVEVLERPVVFAPVPGLLGLAERMRRELVQPAEA